MRAIPRRGAGGWPGARGRGTCGGCCCGCIRRSLWRAAGRVATARAGRPGSDRGTTGRTVTPDRRPRVYSRVRSGKSVPGADRGVSPWRVSAELVRPIFILLVTTALFLFFGRVKSLAHGADAVVRPRASTRHRHSPPSRSPPLKTATLLGGNALRDPVENGPLDLTVSPDCEAGVSPSGL